MQKQIIKVNKKEGPDLFTIAYRMAINKNNWKSAFKIWIDLADNGFIRSSFYTGVCYDNGFGVRKN
jgi:hypothetical protein